MAEDKKVKVYSTPTCPYCKMAKVFFSEKGVDFEDIDVSSNQDAAKEMIEKSGQMGVPVIELNGKIIVGFDKDAIEAELASMQ
jgi:glutaredoxin 3